MARIRLMNKVPTRFSPYNYAMKKLISKSWPSGLAIEHMLKTGNPQRIERVGPYRDIYNQMTSNYLQETEPEIEVNSVAAISSTENKLQKVNICLRNSGNLEVGAKFSTRHGVIGICSRLCADIDMPFSGGTGMRPDIIINPFAFEDTRTIGLLIKSLASKSGALHGKIVNGTSFPTSLEEIKKHAELLEYVREMLTRKGFHYEGIEVFYSGLYGNEMKCDIFMGPVYFERHQQVHAVKAKPTGAAYTLHERLPSDRHICDVMCALCGSFLTITTHYEEGLPIGREGGEVICMACNTGRGIETEDMPIFVLMSCCRTCSNEYKLRLKDPTEDI